MVEPGANGHAGLAADRVGPLARAASGRLADVGEPSADARRGGGSATLPPARSPLRLRTVDGADGIGVEPAGGATARTAEKEAPLKKLDLSRFRNLMYRIDLGRG